MTFSRVTPSSRAAPMLASRYCLLLSVTRIGVEGWNTMARNSDSSSPGPCSVSQSAVLSCEPIKHPFVSDLDVNTEVCEFCHLAAGRHFVKPLPLDSPATNV